ncbi:MAG: TolC family protein [Bacteroidaceae bacterium]|nr:TolC family protein [Bacteroidaceae bacterium]
MKWKMAALLLLYALMATSVPAQRKWTLQDCLDYALANNIQLRQSRLTEAQDAEDVRMRRAALLPSLSFSTNQNASWRPWSQSYVNLSGGTMTSTSSEVNYNGSYGLNANWTVWNGGRNQKNLEKSKLTAEMAEYATEESANSIQEQITQLYVQILYQAEAVRVAEQVLEASKMQRDRAAEMVNVGSLARVDLKQLESQVSQDEYTVVNTRTQLDNYKLRLKQLLELVGTDDFDVAIPTVSDANVLSPVPSKEEVYANAYGVRPEIKSSRLGIEQSELDVNIARRGYLPSVSMTAGMGTNNSSGIHTDLTEQWRRNFSNSIGLTVSVPIFDNRQNRTNVQKAKLSKEAADLSLQNTEQELYRQIESYWLNARNAQQQYVAAKANVESMQETYGLVSEQFRLGLKNIVELTTGKNNLLQAEQQLLQSKYTALYNLAMLRFYQGEPIRL